MRAGCLSLRRGETWNSRVSHGGSGTSFLERWAQNTTSCYTLGVGPFQRGLVAAGLELIPDQGQAPVTHGVIAPVQVVTVDEYQTDLANTRANWRIDES